MRVSNPTTSERARTERDLARTTKAIGRLVQAYQEDLLTLGELRVRMPDLRARQTSLQGSIDALEAQLLDRETYLRLAEDLESFLARLHETAGTATVQDRQKVLRSVVREVLVGPERVIVRHSIPVRDHPFLSPGYPLRWGSRRSSLRCALRCL
jgi:site-specific DNA recombinase